ncbi:MULTISPECIES: hypothetical protein [Brevibacillus]|jgi:uncharacterized alkaline shock family protein YloU|uniref:Uncharacterized protein n=2 Tax=Brevibacillus TaxID=55080 RepID=A0A1I3ZZ97_9BACL|nr:MULTISPECIES: hypothetical protein [Brevibacillus]MDR7318163.1 putative alkaline shock family protein YloU [Brevibacillus nitrificans]MEC2131771.1 hypothetical protein [Brevibacillus centrosporus]MED1791890.1 hypothetical protein [Brevibacillus nitrificans]MED1955009.1 hypothetical protein [Brevibacillus centrosporus]MED4908483.1 hypothetical protein [Brevibacillus centrosporus]
MEIYALYGTSGTGKSSSALELAHRMNIDAIIDDGILIYQGRKVAGTSAKYEKTKIQAVKRAIFHYEEHATDVRRMLQQLLPNRILILGTSRRMIERIVEALELTSPIEYIPIESIKPPQEIEAARYVRETMGKHVIPIPRVEVEKDFLQRLVASAQQIFSSKKEVIGETTVVHPPFTGGRIVIHPQVLRKIVEGTCTYFKEVHHIQKTEYTFEDLPRLQVTLSLKLSYGTDIPALAKDIQQALYNEASYCLNIAPASIDLKIAGLEFASV